VLKDNVLQVKRWIGVRACVCVYIRLIKRRADRHIVNRPQIQIIQ